MRLIFQLSKLNLELAKQEVLSLTKSKDYKLYKDLLILNTNLKPESLADRLAFTKKICKFLFICNTKDLIKKVKSFNWQKVYKKSFCVRLYGNASREEYEERHLASFVWHRIKKPKVDLENPNTLIEIHLAGKKAVCGILNEKIDQFQFEQRRAHLRPALYPTSLHPRLARAVVNLTGIRKGTVTDPFCGTGGLLMEAGLMKLNVIGYDNDDRMLNLCKKNLKHYKIRKFKLKNQDSTKSGSKIYYCVADLPYGLNKKAGDLEKLYLSFLKNLKKNLKKRAVIIMPDFVKHKKILKKSRFRLKQEFLFYIHKSLSRRILVLY